jgi:excisionase family DNA binding protein
MELYRVSEVAKMLDVHPNTVRKWVKARILQPVRLPGSQYSRFTAQEITRLRGEMGFPSDDVARLYRVSEVAKMFAVHPNTVRRWVREDILRAIKLPESNYNRFAPQELNRLRREMGLPPLDEQE